MKKKIIIFLLALFLIFLGGISSALYMVYQTTANLDRLIALHKVEIIRQELVISVQTVQANLYTTGTQFGKELDIIVDNVLKLSKSARRCSSCHHEPDVASDINDLIELSDQYKEALSYFMTSTADPARIARLQIAAADIGDIIIEKSQEMALTANENLRRRTLEATTRINTSKNILTLTIVIAFVISAAIAVFLIIGVSRPIAALLTATRRIHQGELGYTSPYMGKDEFKELIESFNDMSKTLQESNEKQLNHMIRNQTILQTTTDGFLLADNDGRIIDVNPALSKMVGYSREELLTMRFSDIELLESGGDSHSLLQRVRQSGSRLFQTDQKTKKGSLIPAEVSATFTEIAGEGNFFCFVRDISERKKTETELVKVQKLESLGVLAGGIAHDFNNLLMGILGNIDLACRRVDPGDKISDWLRQAKKASERARELTQQLLTFSKGGTPVKQTVSVRELIEESTRFVLSGSNVRYEIHIPENTWPVEADRGQISQVLHNLAINADQAMPEGGTLRVQVENITVENASLPSLAAGKYVKIVYSDEGMGIDQQSLSKIFDPYFTTKKTGNGLGLTICYSIIKHHAGLLVADSTPGAGAVFTIYLPAITTGSRQLTEPGMLSVVWGTGKVLVMDDDEHVREVAAEMLSCIGYEPDLANDGLETIRMYQQALAEDRPYLCVIMDITIPGGMGGKETIRKLLAIDPEVRAIVSSGFSYDPIMSEYRKYGFRGVVPKPYDVSRLSHTLKAVIEQEHGDPPSPSLSCDIPKPQ